MRSRPSASSRTILASRLWGLGPRPAAMISSTQRISPLTCPTKLVRTAHCRYYLRHYLDSTVALGTPDSRGSVRFTATGFLYGYPTGHDDQFTVYLITNEHVIRGESVLKMRLNHSEDTTPQVLDLHLGGELERFVERDAVHDVAVIGLSDSLLDVPGIDLRFIAGDQRVTIETGGELRH